MTIAMRRQQDAEQRLQLLSKAVEQSGSLVIITDTDGRIEYVNSQFCRVSGYTADEILGQTPRIVRGDTPSEVFDSLWSTISAGQVWRGEMTNRTSAGRPYRVVATISPVTDGTGGTTHFVGIQEDITQEWRRQIIETALDAARQAVWQMQRPEDVADLRDAVRSALHQVGVPFRTMGVNIVNRTQSSVLFASAVDGMQGTLSPGEPENAGLIHTWWRAGNIVYRPDLHAEDPFTERCHIEATCGYPVRTVIDVPFSHGTLALNSDVPDAFDADHMSCLQQVADVMSEGFARLDDLRRLESQEQQLRQSQKMEAVGQLAGGVAHDFNNLLTVIKGYTQMLSRQSEGQAGEQLAEIGRAAESAAGLVRQLLAFSRRQVMQPESVNVHDMITGVQHMLRRLLGSSIELLVESDGAPMTVLADPGQLEQVVVNLAVNARDAMPNGGRLSITVTQSELDASSMTRHASARPGRYALLTVADTGIGMARDTQDRIFEPFFTTKASGQGTGLGLATVHGIVQQTGGFLWVYSEPGMGTTFKIYLPLEQADSDELPPVTAASGCTGTETILFVDDNDAVRNVGVVILRDAGFTVLPAANGEAALAALADHAGPVHLLVTDIVMPNMNGVKLQRAVADRHPDLPVLFTSGYADCQLLKAGGKAEEQHFLVKPYDAGSLTRAVRQCLDGACVGEVHNATL